VHHLSLFSTIGHANPILLLCLPAITSTGG